MSEERPQPAPAPPPPSPYPVAPPPMLLRVEPLEGIHWKAFLRIAAPLAVVVGISPTVHPALSWLLLPAIVILAIHLYRRRYPGPLKSGQGAKMGMFTGLAGFGFYALIFAIKVAGDPAAFRQEVAALVQEAIARNPTPEVRQMAETLFSGTGGVVLFSAMELGFLLVFLLVIGSVSGALAARFSKEKSQ